MTHWPASGLPFHSCPMTKINKKFQKKLLSLDSNSGTLLDNPSLSSPIETESYDELEEFIDSYDENFKLKEEPVTDEIFDGFIEDNLR